MSKINDVIHGRRVEPEGEPLSNIVEGEVFAVAAAGITFTIRDWDNGLQKFGPAPWSMSKVEPTAVGDHGLHDHVETLPLKGDRCLVVFTNGGPWVIGWWPR